MYFGQSFSSNTVRYMNTRIGTHDYSQDFFLSFLVVRYCITLEIPVSEWQFIDNSFNFII